MSSPYDRYDTRRRRTLYGPQGGQRRSTLGYWVPLVLTVTFATAGLVAWIWSERQTDDDDEHDNDKNDDRPSYGPRPPSQPRRPRGDNDEYGDDDVYDENDHTGERAAAGPEDTLESPPPAYASRTATGEQDEGFLSRVSGAVRRSPSPQQFFDSAGQRLAAGVAAAGAAVGLGSIREESSSGSGTRAREPEEGAAAGGFSDHERWSEEVETKQRGETQSGAVARDAAQSSKAKRPRRTVAIVVSAETTAKDMRHEGEVGYRTEHASILSHLPPHFDPSTTRLFVLIYAPHLTSLPPTQQHPSSPSSSSSKHTPPSLSSSYSAIAAPSDADDDDEEDDDNSPSTPKKKKQNPFLHQRFETLYTQASALVDQPYSILPFTTPTGHMHILRHLGPSLIYIPDSSSSESATNLCGENGSTVAQLKGWVGQIVVVVGDDDGHAGLVDTSSDDEDAHDKTGHGRKGSSSSWWVDSELVGLGKGVEVVDAALVGDDWVRRVGGPKKDQ
ncbi:hypothetical protein AAFC00_007176 [Neodothiora populina]|uniref:Peroxin 22-like protein n=1 Tax=Neodothiora populina TaxID=2781224 RepID=A0ABR3PHM9_9PEZI